MILTLMFQMNHVPYNLTPGHLSKSDKSITTQTKENELPAIGKSLRYIRSAAHFFHFRSTRSFNNNHTNKLIFTYQQTQGTSLF